jgi:hypothetical protein
MERHNAQVCRRCRRRNPFFPIHNRKQIPPHSRFPRQSARTPLHFRRETKTKWQVEDLDIEELAKDATTRLQGGEVNDYTVYTILKSITFGKNSAAAWDVNDDSATLGLQKKDLREELKKAL